jgi:YidC/Oxa1 family membrane protein insertase
MLTVKGFEQVAFDLIKKDKESISYAYSNSDWRITKTFTIKDKNTVDVKMGITSLRNSSRLEDIQFKTINIAGNKIDPAKDKSAMLYELSILENNKVIRKGNAYKFNPKKDNKTINEKIEWVGYREHYSAFIIKPNFETKSYDNEVLSEHSLSVNIKPTEQPTALGLEKVYSFTIVGGKQNIGWLKTYGMKFEKIVAFFHWGIIDVFAKAIYYLIPAVHFVVRSWGLSIIVVSIIIYGLTYPLTIKSMSSMKKMQTVQPKVQALQKKHKGDPQKLNAEMVDLYKREGVNPLGGCLPFLLQMPIFIALYQVLFRSYYFQGESFLWIKDLALPDRLFILPFSLPFLENEFNILPILMAIVMFFQQVITSKSMVITDDTQAMQQKMMKYFFPVFIGFIFYHFASGLSLYFTVFYGLSAWTQWKMTNTGTSVAGSK